MKKKEKENNIQTKHKTRDKSNLMFIIISFFVYNFDHSLSIRPRMCAHTLAHSHTLTDR